MLMTADGQERVRRLIEWIKAHRADLLDLKGEVSPSLLASVAHREDGEKPRVTYWSDVLRMQKKSFGGKAARQIEDDLKIPKLFLEGVDPPEPVSLWPFWMVDKARWDACTRDEKGWVQRAFSDALAQCEEIRAKNTQHVAEVLSTRRDAQSVSPAPAPRLDPPPPSASPQKRRGAKRAT